MNGKFVAVASFFFGCFYAANANQIVVKDSDAADLMTKASMAVAGDTIWVPAGDYDVSSVASKDPGREGKGWNKGLLWLGLNNGTPEHPIVLAGMDPLNPPSIHGKNVVDYAIVIHVENDYVVLKNLKVHTGSGAITLDNANHVTIEDCELFHTGQEIVHVRDSSSHVLLNRNHIHDSGNGPDKGTYGEGIYIGTSMESWGVDGEPQSLWGSTALEYKAQNRLTYFDWRVNHINVSCNLIHAISSENIDIKEGTTDIVISKNMFSADSLYKKENPRDCDNSFVEVKGVNSTIVRNYMYTAENPKLTAYIDEFNRSGATSNVPQELTPIRNSKIWCDAGDVDGNICGFGENMLIDYVGEVRNLCSETFKIPGKPIAYSGKYKDVPQFPWVESSVSQKYEAENATLIPLAPGKTDNPAVVASNAAASQGNYVAMKNGNLSFKVDAPAAGKYNLKVHYSFAIADMSKYKEQKLSVNGVAIMQLHMPATASSGLAFKDVELTLWLDKGENTLLISNDWGWVDVDYIAVEGAGEYQELFPKEATVDEPGSSASSGSSASADLGLSSGASTQETELVGGTSLSSKVLVQTQGRSLLIYGVGVGKSFAIIDAQGKALYADRSKTMNFEVKVTHPGVYFVKVGGATYPVKVK